MLNQVVASLSFSQVTCVEFPALGFFLAPKQAVVGLWGAIQWVEALSSPLSFQAVLSDNCKYHHHHNDIILHNSK